MSTTETIVSHPEDHIADVRKMVDPDTATVLRVVQTMVAMGWKAKGLSEVWPTPKSNRMHIEWRRE